MRILITASSGTLDSPVDMRFARAPYFIIVDSENPDNPEIISNPFINTPSGAGIVAAQFVVEKGVNTVISGAFGPNSSMILSSAGIQMIQETSGLKVKEVVERLIKGEYKKNHSFQASPNYYGAANYGFFPYGGFGWGRGFGWRRGFGRGWALNWGAFLMTNPYPAYDEKTVLKNMIDNLKNQLKFYEERLEELEKNVKEEK